MLIDAAKKCLQVLLTSRNVIAVSRALLRPFPAIDEEVREQVYRLRKKLISCNKATIISHESDQDIAERDRQPHQFLVDISELVLRDVHTGVQRVVRSVALELLRRPPANYTVEIVYADRAGRLRYARNFANRLTGSSKDNVEDTIVSVRPGDLFFCADLHLTYPFSSLLELKRKGLRIIFTIHDIIALKNPEFFPKALVLGFSDWFNGVMAVADAIVCVSQAAADDVMVWLSNHTDIRTRPLPIGNFHLGADIEASQPLHGTETEGKDVLSAARTRPTLLMVGTLEPRKCHAQALAALELLWDSGVDINLVIIGKEGWRTQRLARQLRRHPKRNQRLFWLEGASDDLLLKMYGHSTALLAASYAEGFGLPLIEAARHGLAIIARDIPVFREVAGDHAFYFQGKRPLELAEAIHLWIALYSERKVPSVAGLPWLTWAESTDQLLTLILKEKWQREFQPCALIGDDRR